MDYSILSHKFETMQQLSRDKLELLSIRDRRIYHQWTGWIWASQSLARSPATVGLISGSCSSARVFAPRFFQAPPRGECYFTLALC